MTINQPIISFITPSKNRSKFIIRCIESIPSRYRTKIEHIIIDGNSNDGSIEIIQKYSHVILISEPDNGLYEAINKGIEIAKGKYLCFLATDDFISESFFENFFDKTLDWQSNDQLLTLNFNIHKNGLKNLFLASNFDMQGIFFGKTPLFTMLMHRNVLKDLKFDNTLKIAGDFDLTLKMIQRGLTSRKLPYEMQNFWFHQESLTGNSSGNHKLEFNEVFQIIVNHYPYFFNDEKSRTLMKQKICQLLKYFFVKKYYISLIKKLLAFTKLHFCLRAQQS